MNCPHYCTISISHAHETDGEWPFLSVEAQGGMVLIGGDDGFHGIRLIMRPEDAMCLALEIQEQCMRAYEQGDKR